MQKLLPLFFLCLSLVITTSNNLIAQNLTATSEKKEILPIKKKGKWGFINRAGKTIVAPIYDGVKGYGSKGHIVVHKKNKEGLLNNQGKEIIPTNYQQLKILDANLFSYYEEKNDKYGLINQQEKQLLAGIYDTIYILKFLNKKYLYIQKDTLCGIADPSGKILVPTQFSEVQIMDTESANPFILTFQDTLKGVFNINGKEVLTPDYQNVKTLENYILYQDTLGFWGLVDKNGTAFLKKEWTYYEKVNEHILKVKNDKRTAFFSFVKKEIIFEGNYDNVYRLSGNYFIFSQNERLGIINSTSKKIIIPAAYDDIRLNKNNTFLIKKNSLYGFTDATGKVLVTPSYKIIYNCKGNLCKVKGVTGKLGLINQYGEEVVTPIYDRIVLEDLSAKLYTGKAVKLISFDENGKEQAQKTFKKVRSFKMKGRTNEDLAAETIITVGEENEYLLDKFEWYFDGKKSRWGLRQLTTLRDIIKPVFRGVGVIKNRDVSVVCISKKVSYRHISSYGMVRNSTGKLITPVKFSHIEAKDFKRYHFARFTIDYSTGLLHKSGKIILSDVKYIDDFSEEGIAIANNSGQWKYNEQADTLNAVLRLGIKNTWFRDIPYDEEHKKSCNFIVGGKWGIIDTTGRIIVPFVYDFLSPFKNGRSIAQKEGKWGVIDPLGNTIIPFQYKRIGYLPNSEQKLFTLIKPSTKHGIINQQGGFVLEPIYAETRNCVENRIAVKQKNKWTFADENGQFIGDFIYSQTRDFKEGFAAVKKGRYWGFINKSGTEIMPFKYTKVGDFKEGLAWFFERGKYGFINTKGEIVIAAQFHKVSDFEAGFCVARVNSNSGIINLNGEWVIEPEYRKIKYYPQYELLVVAKKPSKFGLISTSTQKKILPLKYQKIADFNEGMAAVHTADKIGFIDSLGNWAIPEKFHRVTAFKNGIAQVKLDGKWQYIDTNGAAISEQTYFKCSPYSGSKAVAASAYRKYGLINKIGNYIIEPQYHKFIYFEEANNKGLVAKYGKGYWFIDANNNNIFGQRYNKALPFAEGFAGIRQQKKWGFINEMGYEVIAPQFDRISPFKNGFAQVSILELTGIADIDGNVIIDPQFGNIHFVGEDLFSLVRGGEIGYLYSSEKWLWAMDY